MLSLRYSSKRHCSEACRILRTRRTFASSSSIPQSAPVDHFAEIFKGIDQRRPLRPPTQFAGPSSRSGGPPKTGQPSTQNMRLNAAEIEMFENLFSATFKTQERIAADASSLRQILKETAGGPDSTLVDLLDTSRQRAEYVHQEEASQEEGPSAREILEELRTEMELCASDHELLQWTTRMFQRQQDLQNGVTPSSSTIPSPPPVSDPSQTETEPQPADPPTAPSLPQIRGELAAYPHILTSLLSTFRDKYRNPHLALAIFTQACQLGMHSYVRGCTTATYNELLTTIWTAFRDLQAMTNAVADMKVNGVAFDVHTRRIIEEAMRESANQTSLQWAGQEEEKWELIRQLDNLLSDPHSGVRDTNAGSGLLADAGPDGFVLY